MSDEYGWSVELQKIRDIVDHTFQERPECVEADILDAVVEFLEGKLFNSSDRLLPMHYNYRQMEACYCTSNSPRVHGFTVSIDSGRVLIESGLTILGFVDLCDPDFMERTLDLIRYNSLPLGVKVCD